MDLRDENKMCSFCGAQGGGSTQLVGGLGAMICFDCVENYHAMIQSPQEVRARSKPPWDSMSDLELLEVLPRLQRSAIQVNTFAAEWVALLRERGISWTAIGQALGVSRQAAWERYSKRTERRGAAG